MTITTAADRIISEFVEERGLRHGEVEQYVEDTIRGYINALLWSESCHGTAPLDVCDHFGYVGDRLYDCDRSLETLNYDSDDLALSAREEIAEDVAAFVISCWDDLHLPFGGARITADDAGRNFLLSRNGHGTGFWDSGLGDRGDRLSAMARPFGDTNAFVGSDGAIYV